MATGISINIGINTLKTSHYGSSFRPLMSCIKDAQDMATIARRKNFTVFRNNNLNLPLVGSPTAEDVIKAIKSFSGKDPTSTETPLKAGDTLLVTFAGHGSQLSDTMINGAAAGEEPSGFDQTWCLFDRQILDDELAQLWSMFDEGVRIIFISDCCHSGTVAELAAESDDSATTRSSKQYISQTAQAEEPGFRELLDPFGPLQSQSNRDIYRRVKEDLETALAAKKLATGNTTAKSFRDFIKARVISITACKDDQKAKDGQNELFNGVFTGALRRVWFGTELPLATNAGIFDGTYQSFFENIKLRTLEINSDQEPNFLLLGNADTVFEAGPPFKLQFP